MSEKMLSEIGKGSEWVRPDHIYIIKRTGVDYAQYWSEDKQNFGPLLEATVYETKPTKSVDNGEVVDYREIVGLNS